MRIDQTGRRPIQFRGISIAKASTHSHQGPSPNRWDEYELYVTTGGNYVIEHEYKTNWQGEHNHTDTAKGKTVRELLKNAANAEMWGPMDVQDYPDVINELIRNAGLIEEIAEKIE